jgi:hypothetical protein
MYEFDCEWKSCLDLPWARMLLPNKVSWLWKPFCVHTAKVIRRGQNNLVVPANLTRIVFLELSKVFEY